MYTYIYIYIYTHIHINIYNHITYNINIYIYIYRERERLCIYIYIYIYIYTHIHTYTYQAAAAAAAPGSAVPPSLSVLPLGSVREMGGAPRNPAPGNHLLAWIVKPSGCHCTDASGGREYVVECRPLLGALPLLSEPTPPCPGCPAKVSSGCTAPSSCRRSCRPRLNEYLA